MKFNWNCQCIKCKNSREALRWLETPMYFIFGMLIALVLWRVN